MYMYTHTLTLKTSDSCCIQLALQDRISFQILLSGVTVDTTGVTGTLCFGTACVIYSTNRVSLIVYRIPNAVCTDVHVFRIIESVDFICRDSADTQYMIIPKYLSNLKNGKLVYH